MRITTVEKLKVIAGIDFFELKVESYSPLGQE
jgi:hypothetical protein